MSGAVLSERAAGHLTLTLANPERANAIDPAMITALESELATAAADPGVRCVAIRGEGERSFCAGFDLGHLASGLGTARGLERLMATVRDFPVPVLAVINGHAIGAGFELAACCHLRIAREGAKVGLPAVQLGVAYREAGIAAMLEAAPATRRLLLTGEPAPIESVPGFADLVLPATELDAAVDRTLGALAQAAPAALNYMLRLVCALSQRRLDAPERARFDAERDRLLALPDLAEGVAARRERRPPSFQERVP